MPKAEGLEERAVNIMRYTDDSALADADAYDTDAYARASYDAYADAHARTYADDAADAIAADENDDNNNEEDHDEEIQG